MDVTPNSASMSAGGRTKSDVPEICTFDRCCTFFKLSPPALSHFESLEMLRLPMLMLCCCSMQLVADGPYKYSWLMKIIMVYAESSFYYHYSLSFVLCSMEWCCLAATCSSVRWVGCCVWLAVFSPWVTDLLRWSIFLGALWLNLIFFANLISFDSPFLQIKENQRRMACYKEELSSKVGNKLRKLMS